MTKHARLLIIGAGPAGYTAAIYGARANLQPLLVTGMQPGGQLMITTDVENYPGFAQTIQGPWLMDQMRDQALHVGTEIHYESITKVDFSTRPFQLWGDNGTHFTADAVIIATGASAKWLGLPSEEFFRGFGVSGCATCDGFFFRNQDVAVIGGGNTAVEEALYMTNHARHVYLIHRRDALRAEKIMVDRLMQNPKITIMWNHVVEEVLGKTDPKEVTGLSLKHTLTQEISTLNVQGVFVAIGHTPNTSVLKDSVDMDVEGYVKTEKGTTYTNIKGIFAAGDVQDKIYRQAVTSAGFGCMAALDAEKYLAGH
jgi:thioredoxin reductase (NADPH)